MPGGVAGARLTAAPYADQLIYLTNLSIEYGYFVLQELIPLVLSTNLMIKILVNRKYTGSSNSATYTNQNEERLFLALFGRFAPRQEIYI
jgi:hypothetical protein